MYKLNGVLLTDYVNIQSCEVLDCYKNNYINSLGTTERSIKYNGRINLTCSITYANNEELVEKLNNLEDILKDGTLEVDTKAYNVCILSELEQGMNFSNFKIVFSWDGTYVEDGILTDVSI